jgi:SMI1 / KNR4 family (SUKH-1)
MAVFCSYLLRSSAEVDRSTAEGRVDFDRFQRLLERMERSGVASLSQLVGCSEQEVAALEARYGLRLPEAYTLYLRVMGHKSGRLFTCDHMAVYYRYVLEMTAEQRQIWAEWKAEDGSGPPPQFDLPPNALLIADRLGEQFEFIRCAGQEDSPGVVLQ